MNKSKIRVLIVDDDEGLLKSVAALFTSLGFHVQTATSGNTAFEIVKNGKINVILSDIRMQDGDGWHLARKIRTLPDHPKMLFTTGYSEDGVEQVYHEGIDGFFEKPFNASAVKTAVLRTCVSPVARWSQLPTTEEGQINVTYKDKTLAGLGEKNGVHFGRGGFCFNHTDLHLVEGDVVNFDISIGSHMPFKQIKGIGSIKWRHSRPNSKDVGYGLEIEYIEQDGPQLYHKAFAKEIAWIPSMNLLASQSA